MLLHRGKPRKRSFHGGCQMALKILEQEADRVIVEVDVDYDCPPQHMLDSLGRKQSIDVDVVSKIPRPYSGKKRVVFEFFYLGRYVNDGQTWGERTARGLVCDVYAQIAVNAADNSFADEHQNNVCWKDDQKWYWLCCNQLRGERFVFVGYRGDFYGYPHDWWLGGTRKESLGI